MGYLLGARGFFEIVLVLLISLVVAALAFIAFKKSKRLSKLSPKFFILGATIPPLIPHCYYFITLSLWPSLEGLLLFLGLGAVIWLAAFFFANGLYRFVLTWPKKQQGKIAALIIAFLILAIPAHVLLGKLAYTPCCKPGGPAGINCVTCSAPP